MCVLSSSLIFNFWPIATHTLHKTHESRIYSSSQPAGIIGLVCEHYETGQNVLNNKQILDMHHIIIDNKWSYTNTCITVAYINVTYMCTVRPTELLSNCAL